MNDPWTWTAVWGLTVGGGVGWAEGEKLGQLSQNNNKIFKVAF